jgi:hypothetical protein
MATGTKLTVGILAAALFALLAFAPFASAAPDPVASGTTIVTLKSSTVKAWKKQGVKVLKVAPATLKGSKATFTVTGGSLDPTNGLGTVNLGGGLKFKAGKKSATVKALVLDTSKKSLTANVAGKKMKLATVGAVASARNGFGVNLGVSSLKLTKSAAKQLNKKLGFGAKKSKGHKRASASKASSGPFKANQVLGSASSETQPSTVTIVPGGTTTFATNAATVKKLTDVAVKINTTGATSVIDPTPTKPVFGFPISGGSISPTATAGIVQSSGGLSLVQELGPAKSTISLNALYVDLGAKTVTAEIVAESNVETSPGKKALNLGNLGRSSIADVTLTGGTVTADPATHTVSVQNASATLQPVTAEVLNGFVSIFEGATMTTGKEKFAGGDPLGTFSFTAQTQ